MVNYDTPKFNGFVEGLAKAGQILLDEDPDCILAPMFGSVPFIDIMNVIYDDFPNYKIEFIPASNKVHNLTKVLKGVSENIIEKYYSPEGTRFISIDEVVSGNSLTRVYKQFYAAKCAFADKKTIDAFGPGKFTDAHIEYQNKIRDSIGYFSIGILDPKLEVQGKKQNPAYLKLLSEGGVLPIKVPTIYTMDNVEFFPAKYRTAKDSEGKTAYLPVVDEFSISKSYIDMLIYIAEKYGKDPSAANPKNLVKIRESYKLVPTEWRNI